MNDEKVINSLKMNGFSIYEAKVYTSLLKKYPANGNMIATESGVPSPKVYEVMRKLQEKGYVFLVSSGDKTMNKQYVPLPYQDLIKYLKEDFEDHMNYLDSSLKEISETSDQLWPELFHIEGYETSIDAIKSEIDHSSYEIIVSCWSDELKTLYPSLAAAHKRGVNVVTLLFDQPQEEIPWRNFYHYSNPTVHERHRNELNIVIDDKKAIIFESANSRSNTVISSHQSMVRTTKNYIRHDIYVNRMIHDFDDGSITNLYGEHLEKLIDDF